MDPLQIASVAAVLAKSAWSVGQSLYLFGHDVTNIDQTVAGLAIEVQTLGRACALVEGRLKDIVGNHDTDAGKAEMGHEKIWFYLQSLVQDTQATIDQLEHAIRSVRREGKNLPAQMWRQFKLDLNAKDIAEARDRIRSHTASLQIALQTITIEIFYLKPQKADQQLRTLLSYAMESIEHLRNLSAEQQGTGNDRKAKEQELLALGQATVSNAESLYAASIAAGSFVGDSVSAEHTPRTKEWITDLYEIDKVACTARHTMQALSSKASTDNNASSAFDNNSVPTSTAVTDYTDLGPERVDSPNVDYDSDDEFSIEAAQTALKEGRLSFQSEDYVAAGSYLKEALKMVRELPIRRQSICDTWELRYMLSICTYHTQEAVDAKADLLSLVDLASRSAIRSDEQLGQACDASHFLAIVCIRLGDIEEARIHSSNALKRRQRLLGKAHSRSYVSLALMAKVTELSGNEARARIYTQMIPAEDREAVVDEIDRLALPAAVQPLAEGHRVPHTRVEATDASPDLRVPQVSKAMLDVDGIRSGYEGQRHKVELEQLPGTQHIAVRGPPPAPQRSGECQAFENECTDAFELDAENNTVVADLNSNSRGRSIESETQIVHNAVASDSAETRQPTKVVLDPTYLAVPERSPHSSQAESRRRSKSRETRGVPTEKPAPLIDRVEGKPLPTSMTPGQDLDNDSADIRTRSKSAPPLPLQPPKSGVTRVEQTRRHGYSLATLTQIKMIEELDESHPSALQAADNLRPVSTPPTRKAPMLIDRVQGMALPSNWLARPSKMASQAASLAAMKRIRSADSPGPAQRSAPELQKPIPIQPVPEQTHLDVSKAVPFVDTLRRQSLQQPVSSDSSLWVSATHIPGALISRKRRDSQGPILALQSTMVDETPKNGPRKITRATGNGKPNTNVKGPKSTDELSRGRQNRLSDAQAETNRIAAPRVTQDVRSLQKRLSDLQQVLRRAEVEDIGPSLMATACLHASIAYTRDALSQLEQHSQDTSTSTFRAQLAHDKAENHLATAWNELQSIPRLAQTLNIQERQKSVSSTPVLTLFSQSALDRLMNKPAKPTSLELSISFTGSNAGLLCFTLFDGLSSNGGKLCRSLITATKAKPGLVGSGFSYANNGCLCFSYQQDSFIVTEPPTRLVTSTGILLGQLSSGFDTARRMFDSEIQSLTIISAAS
ncbi:putative tetratricopeptide-like helical domain superfamily [Septoria linicola]|nr:putative tetratricopeptide-like helical domain superfamily [Septoria linicola]